MSLVPIIFAIIGLIFLTLLFIIVWVVLDDYKLNHKHERRNKK